MARGDGARKRRAKRRAAARSVQRGAKRAPVQVPALVAATASTERRAQRPQAEGETFAGSGSSALPLGPRTQSWDASAADKAVRSWADAEDAPNAKYASAFMVKQGDGSNFGDYKLGFAQPVNGTLTANWGGITAVAGVLSGARGGANITDAEAAHAKSLCETFYAKAAKQYGDKAIKVPWKGEAGESAAALLAYAEMGPGTATDDELGGMEQALFAARVQEWETAFAPMPACANCGDAYTAHLGTSGPCTMEECSCEGYVAPDADGDEPANKAEIATAYVRVVPDMSEFQPMLEAGLTKALESALGGLRLVDLQFADSAEDTLPDSHKPGARVPRRRPGPSVPVTPPAMSTGGSWSAIFAPEGKLTSDGRAFAPGSITWRECPLTLMAMEETSEGGHVGAEVAGRIDRIWRDEKAGLIRAQGVWAKTDYGNHIEGLVDDEVLRGVSVDLAIQRYVSGPRSDFFDADGNWAPKEQAGAGEKEPSLLDLLLGAEDQNDPIISVVLEAEIGMTTVCPFPAFAEAKIAPGDSLVASMRCDSVWTITSDAEWAPGGALVASAGLAAHEATDGPPGPVVAETDVLTASAAGLAPLRPPAEWFKHESDGPVGSVFVTDEGRVSGYVAVWDTCHLSFPGQCVEPPRSPSGYAYFHLGEVECEDGVRLACGQITMDTGHAGHDLGRAAALAHYDHTGLAVSDVVAGEDEYGIWIAGALRPDVSAEKARAFRGSKLSGDWRGVNGKRELVAVLCVNVPGFPVPRPRALVAAGPDGSEELISLTAAGIPIVPEFDLTPLEREQLAALAAQAELRTLAG